MPVTQPPLDTTPWQHEGGPTAVLLSHGFTGSPVSMRPWGEYLAQQGMTVSIPLLPGHGTTWQECNRTTWQQWYDALAAEFDLLAASHDRVFVGGLSMGGALALRLAEEKGDRVAGLVLVNAAVLAQDPRLKVLPVLRRLTGSVAGIANDIKKPGMNEGAYDRVPLNALHSQMQGWRQVVADLPTVTCPVLLLRSEVDHVVPAASSARILERIASEDVTEVVLPESYHVATLDHDASTIFERSAEFIRAHGG